MFGGGGRSSNVKSLRSEPKPETYEPYKVPEERAAGRPHELGWLSLLDDDLEMLRFGQVAPGRIIPDD
jgi:hypothetical protein